MIASSVKIKSFSCFKSHWGGFDKFTPISLIIGRNNTGKSHLLDFVELLAKQELKKTGANFELRCTGLLDRAIARGFTD